MLRETVLLALRQIRRNVLRSSLTILGIVIGVAAVITMVTLGGGATAQVASDIAKLGTNLLQVRPGQARRGPSGTRSTGEASSSATFRPDRRNKWTRLKRCVTNELISYAWPQAGPISLRYGHIDGSATKHSFLILPFTKF
jgi:ABC-type antimicrobial peptide transport system permease subunit